MKKIANLFGTVLVLLLAVNIAHKACGKNTAPLPGKKKSAAVNVKKQLFGKTADNKKIDLYTLTNAKGTKVAITNYGATVTSIIVSDRNGKFDDLMAGYGELDGYLKNNTNFGAIIDSSANHARLDKAIWKAKSFKKNGDAGVKLHYKNDKNDLTVTYTLTNANELKIDQLVTAGESVQIKPAWCGYFNLKGHNKTNISDHLMFISAEKFIPVNETLTPTGRLESVKATPFDFDTMPKAIGSRINNNNEQIKYAGGYDHNWLLKKNKHTSLVVACRIYEHSSGRYLEVYTTEPSLYFYSGNALNGTIKGKEGCLYDFRNIFALSTQQLPGAGNYDNSNSELSKILDEYKSHTVYRFSTRGKRICSPVPPN